MVFSMVKQIVILDTLNKKGFLSAKGKATLKKITKKLFKKDILEKSGKISKKTLQKLTTKDKTLIKKIFRERKEFFKRG